MLEVGTHSWTFAPLTALLLLPSVAAAQSAPLSDLHGREPVVADLAPRARLISEERGRDSALVSLVVRTVRSSERRDYAGSVLLSFPTDFLTSSRKAKEGPQASEPLDDEPDEQMATLRPAADVEVDGTRPVSRRSGGRHLPVIRPRDARAALAAAERAAGSAGEAGELDAMGARARWSTLLPQLRLRATRLIDESTSLSPTSYDADRTTSSGGASLWLEARATWNLDRLVFVDEEVRIARLQRLLRQDSERRRRHLLDKLFAWQRAAYAMHDPTATPERCLAAWLTEQQLAAELDLRTGGWFTRWRKRKLLPDAACVAPFEQEAARRLKPMPAAIDGELESE